jgi:hypothetical protein
MFEGFDRWMDAIYNGSESADDVNPFTEPPQSPLPYTQPASPKQWNATKVLLSIAGIIVLYHAFKGD